MRLPIQRIARAQVEKRKRQLYQANEKLFKTIDKESSIAKIPRTDAPIKICIVRALGGVGDVLCVTPALRGLREKYPNAHITYALGTPSTNTLKEVVYNLPFVNVVEKLENVDLKSYSFVDNVTSIDIQVEHKYNAIKVHPPNRIDIYCDFLNVTPSSKLPFYKVESMEKDWAQNKVRQIFGKEPEKLIFLNHRTNAERRNLPEKTLHEISLKLAEEGFSIILSDHEDILWPTHDNIKFLKTSIRENGALLSICKTGIFHDTGIMHLGGALSLPMYTIFGNISPESRINYYKGSVAHPVSCQRCWYSKCPVNDNCIKNLSSNEVVDGFLKFYEGLGK